jgi:stage II sporulation protein D
MSGERFRCSTGGPSSELDGPLQAGLSTSVAAIQVGAFARVPQELLSRLQAGSFEVQIQGAPNGVSRVVVVGRPGESPGELGGRLRGSGFPDQTAATPAAASGVQLRDAKGVLVQGQLVSVESLSGAPIRIGDNAYRGSLSLRQGGDGVRVVNVLPLESYLEGVVPAEMGPKTFPELDALKAQAVAARTYAVARLGEHEAEGYDLCDSVQCQVYGGALWEHPLSSQAVRDTAGLVILYQGKPIQAFYHSTCGGHTEDGEVQFPALSGPYLKGVPCRGETAVTVGKGTAGGWLDQVGRLHAVGEALASYLGVAPTASALVTRLAGDGGGSDLPALAASMGLGEAAAEAQGRATGEDGVLTLLEGHHLGLPPRPAGTASSWELAAAVRLAQLAGDVTTVSGRLLPTPQGPVVAPDGGERSPLTGREVTLERHAERWRRGSFQALPGSPATLWCVAGGCPVLEVEPLASADAGSSWSWWARELSLPEISKKLSLTGVQGVTVLQRTASGRARVVRVSTPAGAVDLPGLAFRYALGLPDSRFTVTGRTRGGVAVLRFLGRGWGHGVGMCQNGAYGLARGGATYLEILKTYYTGVELAHWP